MRTVGIKYFAKERKVEKPEWLQKLFKDRDDLLTRRKVARTQGADFAPLQQN